MSSPEWVAEMTHYRTGNTIKFTSQHLIADWETWEETYCLGGIHRVALECWLCEIPFIVMARMPHLLTRPWAFGGLGKEHILCKRCYNRVNKTRQQLAAERGLG